MVPGLGRAVVRNRWPWVLARTAREAIGAGMSRGRVPLVILQAGLSTQECVALAKFFKAPWRRAPLIVVETGESLRGEPEGKSCEASLRAEGVSCFLSGPGATAELIEELVESMLGTREAGEAVARSAADEGRLKAVVSWSAPDRLVTSGRGAGGQDVLTPIAGREPREQGFLLLRRSCSVESAGHGNLLQTGSPSSQSVRAGMDSGQRSAGAKSPGASAAETPGPGLPLKLAAIDEPLAGTGAA